MGNPKNYPVYWDKILINASQVTNPSIDPLREPMETRVFLGKKPEKLERDENGTIFGFDYEDNYGYKLYTLIYNPDGTIASMALAQSSAGVGYSTKTYNFVYDNGRLAAYQEVSDYPVTYVFGY